MRVDFFHCGFTSHEIKKVPAHEEIDAGHDRRSDVKRIDTHARPHDAFLQV